MKWRIADITENMAWLGGSVTAVVVFILAEGWLILTVKFFGFLWSTVIVTVIPLLIAWGVIYISARSRNIKRFNDWLTRKEEALSKRAKKAAEGGKFIAVFNTALLLGPIIASILMLMLGVDRRRIYVYAVFCAILCAVAWCGFYSGIFWGIHSVITK